MIGVGVAKQIAQLSLAVAKADDDPVRINKFSIACFQALSFLITCLWRQALSVLSGLLMKTVAHW